MNPFEKNTVIFICQHAIFLVKSKCAVLESVNLTIYFFFQYTYDPHSYGVIQSTDHLGRTCTVKWFRTYTTGNEPQPLFVGTTLEPVYDLKDHPDFKYRPGSIVIRVANFNDMSDCTGGQVLDNYTSGQVLVWWANNTTSACWPQDLYKVNRFENVCMVLHLSKETRF